MDIRESRQRSRELLEQVRQQRQQARMMVYQTIGLMEQIERQLHRAKEIISYRGGELRYNESDGSDY